MTSDEVGEVGKVSDHSLVVNKTFRDYWKSNEKPLNGFKLFGCQKNE